MYYYNKTGLPKGQPFCAKLSAIAVAASSTALGSTAVSHFMQHSSVPHLSCVLKTRSQFAENVRGSTCCGRLLDPFPDTVFPF